MSNVDLEYINQAVKLSAIKNYSGSYRSLGGGEINNTYLLDCGIKKVILRIAKQPDQRSLHNEARSLQLLNTDFVPKLVFFDEDLLINDRRWIIETYIDGEKANRLNIKQFESLGSLLAEVHKVSEEKQNSKSTWSRFLNECKAFGNEKQLLNHPDSKIRELVNIARTLFNEFDENYPKITNSLCHGDATPSNILLLDEKVALIDWEFSKFKDPMSEFSTIYYDDIEYNRGKWQVHITEAEKRALFKGYENNGGQIDINRISFWMIFDKLGAAVFLYWRINQSRYGGTTEQIEQYKVDLNNLLESLGNTIY